MIYILDEHGIIRFGFALIHGTDLYSLELYVNDIYLSRS